MAMSDLDRLIRFSVVAEELSFSQAARRLHVDQPWLSRQIQQLETQMGFALFVRSTRKVSLTHEGAALFEHARALARVAEDCRQVSREMVRAHSLKLAIGVSPYTFWLPERKRIVEAFQARHPRVTIEVASNCSSRLVSKLRKRLIDVALISQPFDIADLEALMIHASPISLLVPPEDALAGRGRAHLADLAGREIPVTSPKLNPALWDLMYKPFVDAGAIPLTVLEGVAAVAYYARERRMPVLSVGWPHSDQGMLADFVHVELTGDVPMARFALVRRREPARGLLTHFWNTAKRLCDDGEVEESVGERELVSAMAG
jgi:DNA-binding transcriptional LysR family regulator